MWAAWRASALIRPIYRVVARLSIRFRLPVLRFCLLAAFVLILHQSILFLIAANFVGFGVLTFLRPRHHQIAGYWRVWETLTRDSPLVLIPWLWTVVGGIVTMSSSNWLDWQAWAFSTNCLHMFLQLPTFQHLQLHTTNLNSFVWNRLCRRSIIFLGEVFGRRVRLPPPAWDLIIQLVFLFTPLVFLVSGCCIASALYGLLF